MRLKIYSTDQKVIEYLLHDKQYVSFKFSRENASRTFICKQLMDITLPPDVLVVFIERGTDIFAPGGKTLLKENDILTVIGETSSIDLLYDRYVLVNTK
ncbi:MAG TPA: TrkA C-terminal domain-containing protein [Draconibacterium sp.]|nr:TrkA C-terminal domain-containing protein [Draconibacterium sp.]